MGASGSCHHSRLSTRPALRSSASLLALALLSVLLGACAGTSDIAGGGQARLIVVSVRDQKMTVFRDGGGRTTFPISTSKFGLGDRHRSFTTPAGTLEVAAKIGGGAPPGTVFRGRVRTGEIVKVDAPGRDAIVTRILALRGLEPGNRDALERGIYIHGTPEERNIGEPSSYGCIRMKSEDVIKLYDMVGLHTKVEVIDTTQDEAIASAAPQLPPPPAPAPEPSPAASTALAENTPPAHPAAAAEHPSAAQTASAEPSPKPAAGGPQVVLNKDAAKQKHEWAGSPSKLLADRPAPAEIPKVRNVKVAKPVPGTRQVDNPEPGNSAIQHLKSPALDSL